MKNFLFIIQYDSFAKTLIPVIDYLLKNNYNCDVILLKQKFYKKPWLSDKILKLFENVEYNLTIFKLCSKRKTFDFILKNKYDVITVGTSYTAIIPKIHKYLNQNNLKSKLVSGYVGALLKNNNEGFIKGLQRRAYCDLIWVPGQDAADQILSLDFIEKSKTKIAITGLPRFDELFRKTNLIKSFNKNKIIFFEQPTFPKSKKDRTLLVIKLIKLAEFNKDIEILIKPRFNEKIGHAHRPKYLLQDIFNKIDNKPSNISISYNHIYDLFKTCKLALTISSTAGLESLLVGIPTLFITDFCKEQNLYGSNDFKIFNATISFKDLYKDKIPKINFDSICNTLKFDGKNTSRLAQELIFLSKEV